MRRGRIADAAHRGGDAEEDRNGSRQQRLAAQQQEDRNDAGAEEEEVAEPSHRGFSLQSVCWSVVSSVVRARALSAMRCLL